MTKIVQLTAENVKRLRAVQIRPDGNLVVIGGPNGAGKSSVLDSITYALAGKGSAPSEPIRRGEESAKIVVELDDLVVRRTMTDSGSYLSVETKEGAKYPSPQAILDKLTGSLTFDPLAFTRLGRADQLEQLRSLVGLDFSEQDAERAELYEERRGKNRQAKDLRARIEAVAHHDDAPEEEVSVAELSDQLEAAREHNAGHRTYKGVCDRIIELEAKIEELEVTLEAEKQRKAHLEEEGLDEPADEDSIRQQLRTAEQTNRKVRENDEQAVLAMRLSDAEKESAELSRSIEQIDQAKQAAIAGAEFPIDGLAFDDDAVLYDGIPFDQASQAEQIRVSVAIGLAMNPALNVLLVRDGSLLDADNLRMIAEMADAADAQVWLERVGEGEEVSVVIEDGVVRGAAEAIEA